MFSKEPVPEIDMAKSYFENWTQLKIFILFGPYFVQKYHIVKDVIMLFNHIFKVFKVLRTFQRISMVCLANQITYPEVFLDIWVYHTEDLCLFTDKVVLPYVLLITILTMNQ